MRRERVYLVFDWTFPAGVTDLRIADRPHDGEPQHRRDVCQNTPFAGLGAAL